MNELLDQIHGIKDAIEHRDDLDVEFLARRVVELCDLFAVYTIAQAEADKGAIAHMRRMLEDGPGGPH